MERKGESALGKNRLNGAFAASGITHGPSIDTSCFLPAFRRGTLFHGLSLSFLLLSRGNHVASVPPITTDSDDEEANSPCELSLRVHSWHLVLPAHGDVGGQAERA